MIRYFRHHRRVFFETFVNNLMNLQFFNQELEKFEFLQIAFFDIFYVFVVHDFLQLFKRLSVAVFKRVVFLKVLEFSFVSVYEEIVNELKKYNIVALVFELQGH